MNNLPDLTPGCILVVLAPGRANPLLLELMTRLALRTPLRVVDGGNGFAAYPLARSLRRHAPQVQDILQRIRVARAFTCYQLVALLEGIPADPTPVLALDFLTTFYDESVSLDERLRLLERGLATLRRLSRFAPLAVWARPPKPGQHQSAGLVEALVQAAGQVFYLEALRTGTPPRLF